MKLTTWGQTDIGRLRSSNEDNFSIDRELGLFIVADGMGGHAAGEVASEIAVKTVCESLLPALKQNLLHQDLLSGLKEAINQANQAVTSAAKENSAWQGMGTTLTVLLLQDGQALLGHVGDSRMYRWRTEHLEQLSEDHTLVAEQLRQGRISSGEAGRSGLGHILLQAIGVSEPLDICLQQFPLAAGDLFLLCSDGLTDMLNTADIAQLLRDNPDPEQCCPALIDQALKAGGKDNLTVILIRIDEL